MELAGERILLREFAARDVGALLAVHSDPRVLRYYAPEVGTPEHAEMLVGIFSGWAHENPPEFSVGDRRSEDELSSGKLRRADEGLSSGPAGVRYRSRVSLVGKRTRAGSSEDDSTLRFLRTRSDRGSWRGRF